MNSEAHTIIYFSQRADSTELSTCTSKYSHHCSHIKHSVSTYQLGMNELANTVDVIVTHFSWHNAQTGDSPLQQDSLQPDKLQMPACKSCTSQVLGRATQEPLPWETCSLKLAGEGVCTSLLQYYSTCFSPFSVSQGSLRVSSALLLVLKEQPRAELQQFPNVSKHWTYPVGL